MHSYAGICPPYDVYNANYGAFGVRNVTENIKLSPRNNNGTVSISNTGKWGAEKIRTPGSY